MSTENMAKKFQKKKKKQQARNLQPTTEYNILTVNFSII